MSPQDHRQPDRARLSRDCSVAAIVLVLSLAHLSGCDQPRRSFRLPEGCLPVRYEAATVHSTCLVASVAMSANYLLNKREFNERQIRIDLKHLGYDETRVGDLTTWLQQTPHRLTLLTLTGQLDATPPTGLQYWLEQRGYPVICVINRDPRLNPAFNHAVLVIGISANADVPLSDTIHYLDPSSNEQLHSIDVGIFEQLWARGRWAMMVVVQKPQSSVR